MYGPCVAQRQQLARFWRDVLVACCGCERRQLCDTCQRQQLPLRFRNQEQQSCQLLAVGIHEEAGPRGKHCAGSAELRATRPTLSSRCICSADHIDLACRKEVLATRARRSGPRGATWTWHPAQRRSSRFMMTTCRHRPPREGRCLDMCVGGNREARC